MRKGRESLNLGSCPVATSWAKGGREPVDEGTSEHDRKGIC